MISDLMPPVERDLPPERARERKSALLAAIREGPATLPAPGPGRRRRWAAILLVPAALIAGVTAYAAMHRTPDQVVNGIECDADAAYPSRASVSLPSNGSDPVQVCAHAWETGQIPDQPARPAPPLVACVGQGDAVLVLPGDTGLCDRLGLAALPSGYEQAARAFSAMRDDMVAKLPQDGCAEEPGADATARRILDGAGFADWTIRTDGISQAAPCAVPDFDAVARVVTLTGFIRPELGYAVQRGLAQANSCGPQDSLVLAVRQAITAAGFGDWVVTIDHPLSPQWPCVAGFNPQPETKTIVLTGHATR